MLKSFEAIRVSSSLTTTTTAAAAAAATSSTMLLQQQQLNKHSTNQTNDSTQSLKKKTTPTTTSSASSSSPCDFNCFLLAPNDIWLHVIGPQLCARDLVALSMVCRWTNEIAHEIPQHSGMCDVRDDSPDLCRLKEAVLSWPNLFIKFSYARAQNQHPQLMKNLETMGKANVLEMWNCNGAMTFEFLLRGRLRELSMFNVTISQSACASLAKCLASNKTITSLNLRGSKIEDQGKGLCEGLTHNTNITSLDISDVGVNVEELFQMVATNKTITCLYIDSNGFGEKGTQVLVDGLNLNTHITDLYLRHNNLEAASVQAIANLMTSNKHITNIDLHRNLLYDAGACHVIDALKANSSLTSIRLSGNYLWASSGSRLATALEVNTTLREIDLSDNSLGFEGAQHLCLSLASNTSLTALHLKGNNLGPDGARSVSGMILTNKSLIHLDLAHNHIGSAGAKAIALALQSNITLQRLFLGSNDLSDEGGLEFIQSIKQPHTSLYELDLNGNGIQPRIIESVLALTRTRSS